MGHGVEALARDSHRQVALLATFWPEPGRTPCITLTIAHQLKGVLGAVVPGTDGCTDTKNGRLGPD